ncbi:DUF202 domain-containing protein [Maritimibacter sp. DP1N21-5]|uniref:DUF202 domain-containing protein n=1 Tax=Maritimibacter sp. DP1N21-5 TaxID=2836867 RepID=UPI001C46CD86|nr:DUF202 domain-containing protein [Maritimibacter sp. DP1N21-5]MBV7407567.1 DUF202 domain-containing protein [Maritimibacter sp. DP1N21-5]
MIEKFDQHASNERTFLAWVRTVVAIVGFGIAAARLDGRAGPGWPDAVVLGTGAFVIVVAYLRTRIVARRIDSATMANDEGSFADLLIVLVMLALFALLGAFVLRVSV